MSDVSRKDFEWCETYGNVTRLGRSLVEQGFDAEELQAYYEKPWKWSDEWFLLLEEEANELNEPV